MAYTAYGRMSSLKKSGRSKPTWIIKSAAESIGPHLVGSCTLIVVVILAPKAGSADNVCKIYEIARQTPCCSGVTICQAILNQVTVLTRFVFDFDTIKEEMRNKVHRFSRLKYEDSEFLLGLQKRRRKIKDKLTLFNSTSFQNIITCVGV